MCLAGNQQKSQIPADRFLRRVLFSPGSSKRLHLGIITTKFDASSTVLSDTVKALTYQPGLFSNRDNSGNAGALGNLVNAIERMLRIYFKRLVSKANLR